MPSNSVIRVVIADENSIYRQGLVHNIHTVSCGSICIVGEVDDGENLIVEVERKRPDIVLTDIRMLRIGGIEASRIINQRFCFASVIALTMFTEVDVVYQIFETGAKGCLNKNSDIYEIIEAIKSVYLGDMYYCSSSSCGLIKKIGPSKYNQYKKSQGIHFTDRELQFMKLVCLEMTTKEIASKMKVGTRTVEEYSQNVKEKIDAKNLVGIALYAIKNNIVSVTEL